MITGTKRKKNLLANNKSNFPLSQTFFLEKTLAKILDAIGITSNLLKENRDDFKPMPKIITYYSYTSH